MLETSIDSLPTRRNEDMVHDQSCYPVPSSTVGSALPHAAPALAQPWELHSTRPLRAAEKQNMAMPAFAGDVGLVEDKSCCNTTAGWLWQAQLEEASEAQTASWQEEELELWTAKASIWRYQQYNIVVSWQKAHWFR